MTVQPTLTLSFPLWRRLAALALYGTGALLQGLGRRLVRPIAAGEPTATATKLETPLSLAELDRFEATAIGNVPTLEFCAEAGAPEGALYVNGQYLGRLPGVTRL